MRPLDTEDTKDDLIDSLIAVQGGLMHQLDSLEEEVAMLRAALATVAEVAGDV